MSITVVRHVSGRFQACLDGSPLWAVGKSKGEAIAKLYKLKKRRKW